MGKRTLLLNHRQASQKIKRIAYEILEQNFQEKEIIFAGVVERGFLFAEILERNFKEISDIPSRLIKIQLDKNAPLQSEITMNCEGQDLKDKVIIIIDDVLNTGRTAAYSLKPFLNLEIKKLQTAFLVDRNHKSFPVGADYIGYSLSTSIQDHINVEFSSDLINVFVE